MYSAVRTFLLRAALSINNYCSGLNAEEGARRVVDVRRYLMSDEASVKLCNLSVSDIFLWMMLVDVSG